MQNQLTPETTKVLETLFIAFQYSDLCSSLSDRERGFYFEEYLSLQKHVKQEIEKQSVQI